MHFQYLTKDTCSSMIEMDIEDGVVHNIRFTGGCNGNLKAIPILVEGMKADDVAQKLQGLTCGRRPTSCGDQLARAVLAAKEAERLQKNG